jgi:polyene macrolide polyketide synthase
VFLTAYYALKDLADLREGELLLVHAGAGGVGMAAIQLARHLNAEVFATASAGKWDVLRAMGLDEDHIASSRTLEFREQFGELTGAHGMAVVLDCLAGEFVDASLGLLGDGGRFLEMGKADIRDPGEVESAHPGVIYRAFDLLEAGPERIQEMLGDLLALFERGVLQPLPVRAWDVRHAREAFRFMSQARHVGKNVLMLPAPIDPQDTVLITGGTGGLGALFAEHLASRHGVRHLLLTSRRGPETEGAGELLERLSGLGAQAEIVACDVTDRAQVKAVLAGIDKEHPLTAVVHAAGVLDDGVLESLTRERVTDVLAPKVDGALNLHELTREMDLRAFVLFSSIAGSFGAPGQANYAAANAFLDTLAAQRRAQGLAGVSLAWGPWEQVGGMADRLGGIDSARIGSMGVLSLSAEQGLELFDCGHDRGEALVVPVKLDKRVLRRQALDGTLPALLLGLVRVSPRRMGSAAGLLAERLSGVAQAERERIVLELVRTHTAAVLGYATAEAIEPTRVFKDLGSDSLAAVELRNRLGAETGLRLPASLVFDHPTPLALARFVLDQTVGTQRGARVPARPSQGSVDEPIAIVGMSCRYPGGVSSPAELWQLLAAGGDAISEFPSDRGWDLQGLYDPDPDRPGRSYVRAGGFLGGVADFDAEFFGITPREALAMDPQQRLLLEVCWEALEDGRLDPLSLRASQTGVFAGIASSGYGVDGGLREGVEGYRLTGRIASVVSGRVAYAFGLEGPAVSVDTACSSSLVALHLACQSLRAGECSLALASGVTVLPTPELYVEFSRQRGLAPDGRCKAFANSADGTAWGEGVGVLVLEPLRTARENGRRVLGVVRGSAVNQDGASNGLTAPNGPSQQRVIEQALANARLSPAQIDAVEAHGTGTTLGDPIEAQALIATYGGERGDGEPLWLGSIKSNIGHTAAASGVAGVIKMVMALRHGMLPRTLHVDEPSGKIDWSSGTVSLLTRERTWERNGEPRRAGVSSFGISGTNAHVILEEAPVDGVAPRTHVSTGVDRGVLKDRAESETQVSAAGVIADATPWVLSGRGYVGLRGQAARLHAFLANAPELSMRNVGFSLANRSQLEHRAVSLGEDREELLAGLRALAAGETAGTLVEGVASRDAGGVVFLFPGQGSQWDGMALELLERSPLFARRMGECGDALAPFVDWSPTDVLRGSSGAPPLDRVDVAQPMLFATMVSLAALWRACGVDPDVVVGHSQGEIAAACVAGGLSLDDAARVVALRSRALRRLAGLGGMVSVALGLDELKAMLESLERPASIAAVNGPGAIVVSGEPAVLDELLVNCERQDVRARRIPVDYAAHSSQVEEIEEQLIAGCQGISPRSGEVPFYSATVGGRLDTADLDAGYWYRNLRETVQFERVTRMLLKDQHRTFIEVSPHPVLTIAVQETIDGSLAGTPVESSVDGPAGPSATVVLGSLRRGHGGPARFLRSVAEAWVRGVGVDWATLLGESGAEQLELPTYAFQRRRYWLESSDGHDAAALGQASVEHPLLGAAVGLAGEDGWRFTGRVSLQTHPWLSDHLVMGNVLLPGTALVELALHVASHVGCERVQEMTLEAPLVLEEHDTLQLQVSVGPPDESEQRPVEIYARVESPAGEASDRNQAWTRHAAGVLVSAQDVERGDAHAQWAASRLGLISGAWPLEGAQPLAIEHLYDVLGERGLEYGPAFRGVRAAWRYGEEILAEVTLPEDQHDRTGSFDIHPSLLDCALHSVSLADELWGAAAEGVRLPFSWGGVKLHMTGARGLRVLLAPRGEGEISLVAADDDGVPVIAVDSLITRVVPTTQLAARRPRREECLFEIEWVDLPLAGGVPDGRWVLLGDSSPIGGAILADGLGLRTHVDLPALVEAMADGRRSPEVVIAGCVAGEDAAGLAAAVGGSVKSALALTQAWLASQQLADSSLVFLTRNAVAVDPGEEIAGLADSGVWGLIRSAQSEHPGRLLLVDIDERSSSMASVAAAIRSALASREPQLAIRDGAARVPRAVRSHSRALTVPPEAPEWRLDVTRTGALDGLQLLACPEVNGQLEHGQVRVAMRAAGLNFRDLLTTLGVIPRRGEWDLNGYEGAGVVVDVGSGVSEIGVGDRVTGLFAGCFGPVAVADHRMLVKMPDRWAFTEGASMPLVFLTAYYSLVDLARLQPGERLLVHAATGGVGMAAVQLAEYLGAEVFATASPNKWHRLLRGGLEERHIASSRDLDFKQRIDGVTGGTGVDVVLNSLANEFVDASLDLLTEGGRFIEMGMTDVRSPEEVDEAHPGVEYKAFDLLEAGPERIQEMLAELRRLFERGVLSHLPIRTWDVRRAPEAFRFMSQARHIGKIVLTLPRELNPDGTVLITGGTGRLAGALARHLVVKHGVGNLLLVSRRGRESPGAQELESALQALGASVRIDTCDITDRAHLEDVIASISDEHPLCGVLHTAGVIEDGVVESLTCEQVDRVLAPKVAGAVHLHELTEHLDLQMFVLFSSASGVLGGIGQSNYAAANTFLDALAAHRRARGLPATSMAWGWWAQTSEMTAHMNEADRTRMERMGIRAFSVEEGVELFDVAERAAGAITVPLGLDVRALAARTGVDGPPALLRDLVRVPARRAKALPRGSLVRELAELSERERANVVLELVLRQVANVVGHSSQQAIEPRLTFKELGFDSLLAVELRNLLADASGLRLPATLIFDYPTPIELAQYLLGEIQGSATVAATKSPVVTYTGEPIAIVGMGCRYPGGVGSSRELWKLVVRGGDAISTFPADRGWDLQGLYDPDPDSPGTSYACEGGFLGGVADFDAEFFGISPREALAMDPQQRLLLEVCWEALEDGCFDPFSLRASQTGVFAGIASSGYDVDGGLREGVEGYRLTGRIASVASGRVAYTLGLEGPAVSVDTACSSSLVALHLACQSLRAGECSLALAGGVTVLATPAVFVEFARQRGLSLDGRCKPFSDRADGTGFSEGAGVVVLERLSDAQRLGHEVLAVVRGSAVNQDGASNGLSAPNGPSQQRVIIQALSNAGLSPADIDAVEGHGTGTTLGDPIEAQALIATYGQGRDVNRPLWLGSVKSNIGHTQAAAGIAGVIKMVMALRGGMLPRTLHAEEPSTQVDWSAGLVELLKDPVQWPRNGGPRRVGVSSFGISGTNAHLILEEAPGDRSTGREGESGETPTDGLGSSPGPGGGAAEHEQRTPVLLPWIVSGRGQEALREQAQRLEQLVEEEAHLDAGDIGFSLASGRSRLSDRAVVLGADRDELLKRIGALARGERAAGVIAGRVETRGLLAFMFTGQGAQRLGMGSGLHRAYPVFRRSLDEVCECLDESLGCSLRDAMFATQAGLDSPAGNGLLDRTMFTQTALFALEVALFRLLQGWGVTPDFLIGHSVGELVAAHVSGVLSLQDACRLVAARGGLMEGLPAGGAMISVRASEEQIGPLLSGLEDRVALAAVNGPASVVISGDEDVVTELSRTWDAAGVKTKRLLVSHAFHSPRMDAMLEDFAQGARGLSFSEPAIPIVSNVTGRGVSGELCSAQYWVDHVRATVRFCEGVRWLGAQGVTSFLELGPDGTLAAMARECLAGHSGVTAVPTLRSGRSEVETAISSLAQVWVRGAEVDWAGMFDASRSQKVTLPTYAFQRRRYWFSGSAPAVGQMAAAGLLAVEHPLLSVAVGLAGDRGRVLSGRVSLQTHPWLSDHMVLGTALLSATAFVELALQAGSGVGCEALQELTLQAPLMLGDEAATQLQVSVGEPEQSGQRTVEIHSRADGTESEEGSWTCHATGVLAPRDALETPSGLPARLLEIVSGEWPASDLAPVELEGLYQMLAERGLEYGPAFRGLKALWRSEGDLLAEVALPEDRRGEASLFGLHPALLDAALHGMGLCLSPEATKPDEGKVLLPFAWQKVTLHARGAATLRVCLTASATDAVSVLVADETGAIVASVGSLTVRPVPASQLRGSGVGRGDSLLGLEWRALGRSSSRAPQSSSALIASEGTRLARGLFEIATGEDGEPIARYADLAALTEALDRGRPAPEVVFVDLAAAGQTSAAGEDFEHPDSGSRALDSALHHALELLAAWLQDDRFLSSRLMLVTCGAVAIAADEREAPDLAGAAVWGMARSAQAEHPGRLWLVDLDGERESWSALPAALDLGEPQIAVREGVVHVPRLARLASPSVGGGGGWGAGVTLITGGTGALGGLLARHLVTEHGVRDLVLASRRGPDAPGAAQLRTDLSELGANVTVAACDVSEATQLKELLEAITDERPLSVVHAAGVLDDGLITSLSPQQLDGVLAPKVHAALHLDALTRRFELSAFVLFSSLAATLGSPGQAAYAAANACLDALAARRRAEGLPATSLAWGWWDIADGMTAGLRELDVARVRRSGVATLAAQRGLELFDLACAQDSALVIPARLNEGALRAQARAGTISPLLRGVVRVPAQRSTRREDRSFLRRIAQTPASARARVATELVRAEVADVLGHPSVEAIDADSALSELGFDSLAAVELRNRLAAMSGTPLAATLIFDYPTSSALAAYLLSQLTDEESANPRSAQVELDRLERVIPSIDAEAERDMVAARLQRILAELRKTHSSSDGTGVAQSIESASDEEIFGFIDRELGRR